MVHKRLASSAVRAAASAHAPRLVPPKDTLPASRFPPKEALYVRQEIKKAPFSPEVWAALQPPPPSALSAFAHRIGLATVLDTPAIVQQACTHSSFLALFRQQYPTESEPLTNAQLSPLGNALMGLFASEYLHAKYPYLPTRVLKAAVTAHVGPLTCSSVAQEMGASPLLRWHRTPQTFLKPAVLHTEALSSIPRSLTALIYQKQSLPSARQFVHSHFLTREIDLRSMLKFTDPKKALLEMVNKFGRERPKSRLLKETGRFSNSPIFVVGIYSGADQLGEGFGSSLKMAEFRAAEDALHRVYLTRTPEAIIQVPTSTFTQTVGDVFPSASRTLTESVVSYTPPPLAMPEIMYASSGKSRVTKMQ